MPRFLLTEEPDDSGLVRIRGSDARHLAGPLRARPGERLAAAHAGRLLDLEVLRVSREEVVARVLGEPTPAAESVLSVTLLIGMPKGPRFETAVEKTTELGVARIQPLLLERSVARVPEERSATRLTRWRRIAEEARKQCGRAEAPEVLAPVTLEEALRADRDRLIVLDAAAAEALEPGGGAAATSVAVLIGPEGGLTELELAAAERAGGERRRLARHVLRTETAAIAACAVLLLPGAVEERETLSGG